MIRYLFYLTPAIFTLNVIMQFMVGETYTGIQLGLATLVLWLWAYIIEKNMENKK